MLRPKRRITKKELKQDEFLEFLYRAEQFVRQNAKTLSYIGVGVLVVAVVSVMMYNSRQNAEMEAATAVGTAQGQFDQGSYQQVITALEPVVETYAGTENAGTAVFYLGSAHYRLGEYGEAEQYFHQYLDEYDTDPTLSASALASLGSISGMDGNTAQAADYFQRATRKAPYKFLMHEYTIESAHYYMESGQTDPAKKMLTTLLNNEALNSDIRQKVQGLLEQIEVMGMQ